MKLPTALKRASISTTIIPGVILLCLCGWQFAINAPALAPGHLNAGDDHMHVAISNELLRVLAGDHKVLGWNAAYGPGVPMFLLRPPGIYVASVVVHYLTSFTIEQSLKLLVVLGLSLYPCVIFFGCRLLELEIETALFAAALSPLGISTWGHTLDAYHYLGIHKQLLAILMFPIAAGLLWRLLVRRRGGSAFAFIFPAVFLTHPYIAYCIALLLPVMLIAAASRWRWNWARGIARAGCAAMPALMLVAWWIVPFFSSGEVQQSHPFLSARKYFDVVGCTVTETLRQFILGGLFDTTRWSTPFGHHEWGWVDNGQQLRIPIVSALALIGFFTSIARRRTRQETFVVLAFLAALIVFIGPDDFPFLDLIPFSQKFQNIHSIFLLEWTVFVLGAIGCRNLVHWALAIRRRKVGLVFAGALATVLIAAWTSAAVERTEHANQVVDVKPGETRNGLYYFKEALPPVWKGFDAVVKALAEDSVEGNVAAVPGGVEDTVLYNLLPEMVGRPVYLSGFEDNGGLYQLLLEHFRTDLLKNKGLQSLFDIRHVITDAQSSALGDTPPAFLTPVVANDQWRLYRTDGATGMSTAFSPRTKFIGFAGSDDEWSDLMKRWLEAYRASSKDAVWFLDVTGMTAEDIAIVRPHLAGFVLGSGLPTHPFAIEGPSIRLDALPRESGEVYWRSLADLFPQAVPPTSGASADAILHVDRHTRSHDEITVEASQPVAVLLRRSFYRSWTVSDELGRLPMLRASPGLQLTIARAGVHHLRWSYPGPNHYRLSEWLAALGLALGAVLLIYRRRWGWLVSTLHRQQVAAVHALRGPAKIAGRLLPNLAIATTLSLFAWGLFGELARKEPVTIYPTNGQVVTANDDGSLEFFWNFLSRGPTTRQTFVVEVSEDPSFAHSLGQFRFSSDHGTAHAKLQTGRTYYYRIAYLARSGAHWTRTRSFFVAKVGT